MAGASDQLRVVMNDIDKAQQLVKNKIATLPIAANQPMGPPTIMTNPPVVRQQMTMAEDKAAKKRTSSVKQQYPDWDSREYMDSKSRRQAHLDAQEKLREERTNGVSKKGHAGVQANDIRIEVSPGDGERQEGEEGIAGRDSCK